MVSIQSKRAILTQELEICENTIYLHEVRVECGTRTNDEKMVKANQDAITKCLLQRNILQGLLEKLNAEAGEVTEVKQA